MKKSLNLLALLIFVVSCAGSAEHKVVSANQAGDRNLSCSELDQEIVRAQVIIDGVNEDKSGISGADWIDGILWFPFNLIAKSQNYKNATQAADRRIKRWETIKEKKNCAGNQKAIKAKSSSIVEELNTLTDLYKRGDITRSEYEKAKKDLLN